MNTSVRGTRGLGGSDWFRRVPTTEAHLTPGSRLKLCRMRSNDGAEVVRLDLPPGLAGETHESEGLELLASGDAYKPSVWRKLKSKYRSSTALVKASAIVCGLLVAGLAVLVILASAGVFGRKARAAPVRGPNVIFMISDGFGPSGETMARVFANKAVKLPLDYQLVGSSITYSATNLVTDSAAGATAYSCAQKTYNYGVAVDVTGQPCATLLEAAAAAGLATGAVVTSRVTHATPAAFTAHVVDRELEYYIAQQQVQQRVDVLFGGGLCEFLPKSGASVNSSCRPDALDLLAQARASGFSVLTNLSDLAAPSISFPALGLFALSHLDYEIDRNPAVQPSLVNMTRRALALLAESAKGRERGFFLLIEGSRIDHAGHNNDPGAHVIETLMYQQTFEAALAFAAADGNTLVLSTSDHETGGLTLARTIAKPDGGAYSPYYWLPEVLARASHSCEWVAQQLVAQPGLSTNATVAAALGVTDLTADELARLDAARSACVVNGSALFFPFVYELAAVLSYRAVIGWTTHGHTGIDVNLYAFGPGVDVLRGVNQNVEIGAFVESTLGVNLAMLTPEIQKRFSPRPPAGQAAEQGQPVGRWRSGAGHGSQIH